MERFVITEIEEFAFIRRVHARDDFGAGVFIFAPRALMKESVNRNLVSVRGQFVQPGTKTGVGQGAPLSMVIRNDEKRADANPAVREFRENFLDLWPGRRSDVMD